MLTPEEKATRERQAKRAAREALKTARTQWRDAKIRIGQIKAEIDTGDLTDADKGALKNELKVLKATLPGLGETMRSTKATWEGLKDRLKDDRNNGRGIRDGG